MPSGARPKSSPHSPMPATSSCPGLIWAVAILVAILGTLTQPDAEAERAARTVPTEAATVAYGA